MHIQQKIKLIGNQAEYLGTKIKKIGGQFVRTTFMRDWVFAPDTRAYNNLFCDRFAFRGNEKGLFLRLREENDLTSGKGSQTLNLYAYQLSNQFLIDEQIKLTFEPRENIAKNIFRFLELTGFDQVVETTKKREEYILNFQERSLSLYFDTLENLPQDYMEMHAFIEKNELPALIPLFSEFIAAMALDPKLIMNEPYHLMLLNPNSSTKDNPNA